MNAELMENFNYHLNEAHALAKEACDDYIKNKLDNFDGGACGFAWVEFLKYDDKKIDGRSKVGKLLKKHGIKQDYKRIFYIWNPSQSIYQNIDCKLAGARAFANYFNELGFMCYPMSRVD